MKDLDELYSQIPPRLWAMRVHHGPPWSVGDIVTYDEETGFGTIATKNADTAEELMQSAPTKLGPSRDEINQREVERKHALIRANMQAAALERINRLGK